LQGERGSAYGGVGRRPLVARAAIASGSDSWVWPGSPCPDVKDGAVDAEPPRQTLPITSTRDITMAQCEVCGNDYELSFEVIAAGNRHVFDSFECAIFMLAPVCDHCGVKIIGHGIQGNGAFYCCAHCARHEGETGAVDHL